MGNTNAWSDIFLPEHYLLPSAPVDPFDGLTPLEAVELSERVQADCGIALRRATMPRNMPGVLGSVAMKPRLTL